MLLPPRQTTAIRQGDLRRRLSAQGFDLGASTPQEFAAHIRSELARFAKLIKMTGIRLE